MPERLSDQGKVYVSRHEMRRERMLQNVGVSLLPRQAGRFGNGSEHAEELRAVELPALLAGEQIIAAVLFAFAEPGSDGVHFVEERLATVRWLRYG
jgi:hypothetical protein